MNYGTQLLHSKLKELIDAFCPVIYIVAADEAKVLKILNSVAEEMRQSFVCWSCTKGFEEYKQNIYPYMNELRGINDVGNIGKALQIIENISSTDESESVIFAFRNINESLKNDKISRQICDVYNDFKTNYKTLVAISPVCDIPDELGRVVTVLKYQMSEDDIKKNIISILMQAVSNDKEKVKKIDRNYLSMIIKAARGLTEDELRIAVFTGLLKSNNIYNIDVKDIHIMKKGLFESAGVEYIDTKKTFKDVGGLTAIKNWCNVNKNLFSIVAEKAGVRHPKSICFVGPHGTGKSTFIKAMSNEWGLPLVKSDKVLNKGQIKMLGGVSPCIVWYDNLLVSKTDVDLLNREGCFVVLSDNLDVLDNLIGYREIFDEVVLFELPAAVEIKELVAIILKKHGISVDDISDIVSVCSNGYSGAEICKAIDFSVSLGFILNGGKIIGAECLKDVKSGLVRFNWEKENRRQKLTRLMSTENIFTMAANGNVDTVSVPNVIGENADGVVNLSNVSRHEAVPLTKSKPEFQKESCAKAKQEEVKIVNYTIAEVLQHSKMLDPHINPEDNLDVPGVIKLPGIEGDKVNFTKGDLENLKRQFNRFVE